MKVANIFDTQYNYKVSEKILKYSSYIYSNTLQLWADMIITTVFLIRYMH